MSNQPKNNRKNAKNPKLKSGLKEWQSMKIKDILVVEHMMERFLKQDMSKEETIEYLYRCARFEPLFSRAVWENLERKNPEFFRAYAVRQALKNQIIKFNELLEKQAELMSLKSVASCVLTESLDQQSNESGNKQDKVSSATSVVKMETDS